MLIKIYFHQNFYNFITINDNFKILKAGDQSVTMTTKIFNLKCFNDKNTFNSASMINSRLQINNSDLENFINTIVTFPKSNEYLAFKFEKHGYSMELDTIYSSYIKSSNTVQCDIKLVCQPCKIAGMFEVETRWNITESSQNIEESTYTLYSVKEIKSMLDSCNEIDLIMLVDLTMIINFFKKHSLNVMLF